VDWNENKTEKEDENTNKNNKTERSNYICYFLGIIFQYRRVYFAQVNEEGKVVSIQAIKA
jgi:hypothetical protein